MADYSQINVACQAYIAKTPALIDNAFQAGPVSAYLRANCTEKYTGGNRTIESSFIYDGLIGGFYNQGEKFDTQEKQIEEKMVLGVKRLYVGVTLDKEDLQVHNKGENAVFKLIESRMQAAYMTIGQHLELSVWLNGTNANYTRNLNGFPEALNDNSVASWDGNTYATYAGKTRGGKVGTSLNSTPISTTTLELTNIQTAYTAADFGEPNYAPNVIVTTPTAYTYVENRFQTQQRFTVAQDPVIGFSGLKYRSATFLCSRYVPGSFISGATVATQPIVAQFISQMSGGNLAAYPTVTGETMWFLNLRKPFIEFYVTDDKEFGFGFNGFKPGRDDTQVTGQVIGVCALVVRAPRYHTQVYGFSS